MRFCSACGQTVEQSVPAGDNRPRYCCAGCGTIHYQNPRMVLGTVPVWGDQILLCRRAIDEVGLSEIDAVLNGTTSLATTTEDPIAPFRVIGDYSKKLGDVFTVKAGFMDGKVLSQQEMADIATLPSKEALYSKVLGTMLAPITSLAVVLGQIVEQKGGSLESAEPAAE